MDTAVTRAERPIPAGWPLAPMRIFELIVLIVLVRLFTLIAIDGVPLSGDEAQYWLYGEYLAGGYYSKPPLMPWLIRFSTDLFGDSAWAIRLPALLMHPIIAAVLFVTGRRLFSTPVGAVAALVYLSIPAVSVSSLLASTDPAMMLGWALATLALLLILEGAGLVAWLLMGLALGLGLLGKYTAGAWLLGAFLLFTLDPFARKRWSWWGGFTALIGLVIALAPNLWWNIENGFSTITHIGENANLQGAGSGISSAEGLADMGEFLATQLAVFGPVSFVILVWLIVRPATWKEPRQRVLLALGLPLLAIICAQAFLNRANANWAAPAYLGFVIVVAAWMVHARPAWLKATLWVNGIALIGVTGLIVVYGSYATSLPRAYDPFRKLRGTEAMIEAAQRGLDANPGAYLVSDDRMVLASVIHGTGQTLERVAKWDNNLVLDDHFEMVTSWPDPASEPVFIFVAIRPVDYIANAFGEAELLSRDEIQTHADDSLHVEVWRFADPKDAF